MVEPIEEFLEQAAAERKPLSEQEKEEAMVVAREVWKKAMEYAESPASSNRGLEDKDSHTSISIYKNPRPQEFRFGELLDPNTDLVITLVKTARDANTFRTSTAKTADMDIYIFSPSKVTKLERRMVPTKVDRYVATGDRIQTVPVVNKDANRQREQETQEGYHPKKEDLQDLLNKLSSAKTVAFLIKNSSWPA